METVFHGSISKSSAFVAYGTAAPRSTLPKILALVVGILALLGFGAYSALIFSHVPLPEKIAALAFVKPSVSLPENTPAIWREAQNAAKPLPIFVGFMKTGTTTFEAFAVTPRHARIEEGPNGLLWNLAGSETNNAKTVRFSDIPFHLSDFLAPAWFMVSLTELLGMPGNQTLDGPIKGNRWEVNVENIASTAPRTFSGNGLLNLDALPAGWELAAEALAQEGFILPSEPRPSAIRWSSYGTSTAFTLEYTENLPEAARVALAAGAGLADEREITLPDGTTALELRPPVEFLVNSTSTSWKTPENRVFHLMEREASYLSDQEWPETRIPDRCPGDPLAVLPGEATKKILEAFGIPLNNEKSLYWMSEEKKLTLCW